MDQNQAHSDFITATMQFLAERPGSQILIIVEGPRGFETFRNTPSFPWLIGCLSCAKKVLKDAMKAERNPEEIERRNREEQEKIQRGIEATKGKTN